MIVSLPVEDVCEAPEDGEHDGEDRPGRYRAKHALFITTSSDDPALQDLNSFEMSQLNLQNINEGD